MISYEVNFVCYAFNREHRFFTNEEEGEKQPLKTLREMVGEGKGLRIEDCGKKIKTKTGGWRLKKRKDKGERKNAGAFFRPTELEYSVGRQARGPAYPW